MKSNTMGKEAAFFMCVYSLLSSRCAHHFFLHMLLGDNWVKDIRAGFSAGFVIFSSEYLCCCLIGNLAQQMNIYTENLCLSI